MTAQLPMVGDRRVEVRWAMRIEFANGTRRTFFKPTEAKARKSIDDLETQYREGGTAPYWDGAVIWLERVETRSDRVDVLELSER